MVKYFKNNKSYYNWYTKEKTKYDVVSVNITKNGYIKLECLKKEEKVRRSEKAIIKL